MGAPTRTDRSAVAARTETGRLCTVTVQPDPLGRHELHYEGSESTAALLTPEVVELLTVALSVRGRSAIPARCAGIAEWVADHRGDGTREDVVAKDPDEGKHTKNEPARSDGKVPDGTKVDPREPKPDGKHGR